MPQLSRELKHRPFLDRVLSTPSSPFREGLVLEVIEDELTRNRVPHFRDPAGNLVVGLKSEKDYLKLIRQNSTEPVRLFIAHLDHPGFIGTAFKDGHHLEVEWHGGTPTEHLVGAKVWLATSEGRIGHGKIAQVQLTESKRSILNAVIELPEAISDSGVKAPQLFGGFDFRAPVWEENGILYSKAADDLVGSFTIASLAIDLFKKRKAAGYPFIGLLTRAEEVGYIGALHHFELGWLKKARRPVIAVSLETSRTLPGAEIGKGPVVRLGDKFGVFDARALHVLSRLAAQILPDSHQKRVMDGGTCEATAAICSGIPAIGISIPLGNYHNQSLQGGPDAAPSMGPAPEFVSLQDISGMLAQRPDSAGIIPSKPSTRNSAQTSRNTES
jgi:endoglucanase